MNRFSEWDVDAIERDLLGLPAFTESIFPDSPRAIGAPDHLLDAPPYANCVRISAQANAAARAFSTGLIVGPDLILTVGHGVGEERNGSFSPFSDFVAKTPLEIKTGQPGASGARDIYIHRAWSRREGDAYDLALIRLKVEIKWPLQFESRSWAAWGENPRCVVLGFPLISGRPSAKLIISHGRVEHLGLENERFFHNAATLEGNSGAPIIIAPSTGIAVVGVHVGGRDLSPAARNVAVRVDQSLTLQSSAWSQGQDPDPSVWLRMAGRG
jgi:V8-like Glu-specific endopeptidase